MFTILDVHTSDILDLATYIYIIENANRRGILRFFFGLSLYTLNITFVFSGLG